MWQYLLLINQVLEWINSELFSPTNSYCSQTANTHWKAKKISKLSFLWQMNSTVCYKRKLVVGSKHGITCLHTSVNITVWTKVWVLVSPSTINKMFEIYTFSKIRPKFAISLKIWPKFTLFLKIGSKFILAFCSKIGPKFC